MYKDADKWRKYKRDYNALLKANHLCRDCKAQDGHTLNGFLLCWDCQQKANDRQRERRSKESYKAQRRIEVKVEYDARKSEGKCPQCGGTRDSSRYKLCAHCRALKRMGAEKKESVRRIIENVNWPRGANGYCWRCNKQPSIEGKHLCAKCYRVQLGLLDKAHAANERRKNAERKQGRRRSDGEDHRLHPGERGQGERGAVDG